MPLDFKTLPMMELRSAPGEVLDRVARSGEAFVIERNGQQLACLVPLSVFMPDIQPARIARELEQLNLKGEDYTSSITDDRELEFRFNEGRGERPLVVTIRLPHGYPNSCPKVFVDSVPEQSPHRWPDGSLCIFGAMELWNPGKHDVLHVLALTRRWISNFQKWEKEGVWEGQNDDTE